MRSIDADTFEQDLKEKLLPLLVKKYGKEEAMKGLHFSLQDCISNIQSQPTITQPEPEWIPCSERLPEPYEHCLWTTIDGRVVYHHCDGLFSNYTAWMPLPEPYRGEQK